MADPAPRRPSYGLALHYEFPPAEFGRLCQEVEAAGFARVWVPDERFLRDASVGLTLAAVRTERVGIGTAVTDPFVRHPALTAAMAATLDELSGGRMTLGIGAGVSGFAAMAIARERPQVAIREAVELMRALWRGERVSYAGATTSFAGAGLDFAPLRPAIPVWIAGRGARILQLAGEVGDGALIGALCSEPGLRYANTQIDLGLARSARPRSALSRAIWLHTAVASDEAVARDAVRPIVAGVLVSSGDAIRAIGLPVPEALLQRAATTPYGVHNPEMLALARTLPTDVLDHLSVAGTPGQVAARLADLAGLGIDHLAIVPWLAPGQSMSSFIGDLAAALAA